MMKFLLDENVDRAYKIQLLQQVSQLEDMIIGEAGAPPKGTLDPKVLEWCEQNDFVLVTNNRSSMPVHLAEHLASDRHIPGILILNANLSIGRNLEELILIALAAFDQEFQDRIEHLPLP
ncbi:DUF5615 family PIN-like protein [Microcoleus sp. FACHB-1515]|uniref:DUF5615 family PIN-like protein n=1 Tax=Cyanophyceae TaxID=3028117 RepID=UPI001686E43E|nr:DUF5615 family PIN-like protein [Microcoleus sp. FACHB-1515]MBD2092738.1 DUF5615 family PIN-like protein [Microcoleus sp. FACHB-1515]